MQLHITKLFYNKESSTLEVTPRVEEDVVSLDVPQVEETINDVDNNESNKELRREARVHWGSWILDSRISFKIQDSKINC